MLTTLSRVQFALWESKFNLRTTRSQLAKAQKLQEQLEKYPDARAVNIEDALNEAVQQDLVTTSQKLVSVNATAWLHVKAMAPKIISPKPKFIKL